MLVFGPSTKRRCLVNPRKAFLGSLWSLCGPGGSGGWFFLSFLYWFVLIQLLPGWSQWGLCIIHYFCSKLRSIPWNLDELESWGQKRGVIQFTKWKFFLFTWHLVLIPCLDLFENLWRSKSLCDTTSWTIQLHNSVITLLRKPFQTFCSVHQIINYILGARNTVLSCSHPSEKRVHLYWAHLIFCPLLRQMYLPLPPAWAPQGQNFDSFVLTLTHPAWHRTGIAHCWPAQNA